MNNETAMDATNLTQLSSREQLSALMDGALPADETRFLLRRLQHDSSLAECWERWRLSAEVMRGLAPAQRLPVDFAARVAASLRGEQDEKSVSGSLTGRSLPWLRWGGGAAMAASLAMVAFMFQPEQMDAPEASGDTGIAAANAVQPHFPEESAGTAASSSKVPLRQDPSGGSLHARTAALASVIAVASARASRKDPLGNRAAATRSAVTATRIAGSAEVGNAASSSVASLLPQADIVTRPWPRSVLPQYGNSGITVGFGESTRLTAPYNPFQVRRGIGGLPPTSAGQRDVGDAIPPAGSREGDGVDGVADKELPQP